jgi:uncharacterized membrane protein YphA (DoxX/SURF4 family)
MEAVMRNVISWLETRRELCFELLRMYLGVGLLVKGVLFASDPEQLARLTSEGHMDGWAALIQHYIVPAHVVGGVMLAMGLLTRIAAIVNLPALLGAVLFVHTPAGLFSRTPGFEFSLFVLFVLVLIAWYGGGRWSLDHRLFAPAPGAAGDATDVARPRPVAPGRVG